MKGHMLFLYLKTGSVHLSTSSVLKKAVEERNPDPEITLLNGCGPHQFVSHTLFEFGYHLSCNYFHGAHGLIFDLTCRFPWLIRVIETFLTWRTAAYLTKYLRKHDITGIISFHFAVSPAAVKAIRRVNPSIPFIIIVTDPYTAHPVWFYEKKQQYVVFSEQIRQEMVSRFGIDRDKIFLSPFILGKQFVPLDAAGVRELKKKYGIAPERKTLLVAGGGEGLPGSVPLVLYFLRQNPSFKIIIVCGRNYSAQKQLEAMRLLYPDSDITVYGFVSFMDELIQLSDCVVTKAGPATMMEVLKCGKPVIFSTYIPGQELGNIHFVVDNKVGWFIRKPENIYRKVSRLFSDADYYREITERLEKLKIDTDINRLCDFIDSFPSSSDLGEKVHETEPSVPVS